MSVACVAIVSGFVIVLIITGTQKEIGGMAPETESGLTPHHHALLFVCLSGAAIHDVGGRAAGESIGFYGPAMRERL